MACDNTRLCLEGLTSCGTLAPLVLENGLTVPLVSFLKSLWAGRCFSVHPDRYQHHCLLPVPWQQYVILPWHDFSLSYGKTPKSRWYTRSAQWQFHFLRTVLNPLPLFSSATDFPIPQQVNVRMLLNAPWCPQTAAVSVCEGVTHPTLLMAWMVISYPAWSLARHRQDGSG